MLELLTVPAIILAIESIKAIGLPTAYAPLAAIIFGSAFGLLTGDVVTGLLVGLSASGVYSGARAILKE